MRVVTAPAIVVVSAEQLVEIVETAVARAFATHAPAAAPTPALVDKREIARVLGVSPATIGRMTAEGMPHFYVGASPRYDVGAVRQWLAERGQRGTVAAPARTKITGVRLLGRAR